MFLLGYVYAIKVADAV